MIVFESYFGLGQNRKSEDFYGWIPTTKQLGEKKSDWKLEKKPEKRFPEMATKIDIEEGISLAEKLSTVRNLPGQLRGQSRLVKYLSN